MIKKLSLAVVAIVAMVTARVDGAPLAPQGGTVTGVAGQTGGGLAGGGVGGLVTLSLLRTCAAGQGLRWSGSAWGCGDFSSLVSGTLNRVAKMTPDGLHVGNGNPVDDGTTFALTEEMTTHVANLVAGSDFVLTQTAFAGNSSMLGARVSGTVNTAGGALSASALNIIANATHSNVGGGILTTYGVHAEADGGGSAEYPMAIWAYAHGGVGENFDFFSPGGDFFHTGPMTTNGEFTLTGTGLVVGMNVAIINTAATTNTSAFNLLTTGSYDATAGTRTSTGLNVACNTTRSSATGLVECNAIVANASGSDKNFALNVTTGNIVDEGGFVEVIANGTGSGLTDPAFGPSGVAYYAHSLTDASRQGTYWATNTSYRFRDFTSATDIYEINEGVAALKLDVALDANSHKLQNLTNGAAAQDAVTLSQLTAAVSGLGTGTVTSITCSTGINCTASNPITTSGTVTLANTAVSPGSYTYGGFTVDQQGRITAASSGVAPLTASNLSGTSGRSVRFTATNTGGNGAWTDDGTNATALGNLTSIAGVTTVGNLVHNAITVTLTGTVNAWAPAGLSTTTTVIASSSAGSPTLNGITGCTAGRQLRIVWTDAVQLLTIQPESASASANDRITSPYGVQALYMLGGTSSPSITLECVVGATTRWVVTAWSSVEMPGVNWTGSMNGNGQTLFGVGTLGVTGNATIGGTLRAGITTIGGSAGTSAVTGTAEVVSNAGQTNLAIRDTTDGTEIEAMVNATAAYIGTSTSTSLHLIVNGADSIVLGGAGINVTGTIGATSSIGGTGLAYADAGLDDGGTLYTITAGTIQNARGATSGTFTAAGASATITYGAGHTFAVTPTCIVSTDGTTKGFAYTRNTTTLSITSMTAAQKYDWACWDH